MDYTQNIKIAQVTEKTLVVGVDIGSETNYARAFNWRGQELSKKVFRFSNSLEGFQSFIEYLKSYQTIASTEQIIVGCEPTGHYWFNLARYLNAQHICKAGLQGLGKAAFATVNSFCELAVRASIVLFFADLWGASRVFWAEPVTWTVGMLILAGSLFFTMRKKRLDPTPVHTERS